MSFQFLIKNLLSVSWTIGWEAFAALLLTAVVTGVLIAKFD